KQRCERVIENKNAPARWLTPERLQSRWIQRVNDRIRVDCLLTSRVRARFGNAALSECTVLATWSGTLQDEGALPVNWIQQPEILVGI
ncbi:hypothetical protein BDZ89DRAFT_900232, partial [Hymenopellis radicata]